MAMSFEDARDLATKGLIVVLFVVLGYFANIILRSASKSDINDLKRDVKEMIQEAARTSQYAQDKPSIDRSIADLYTLVARSVVEHDKIKETAHQQNEKLWQEIASLRIEIEKLHLKSELERELDDQSDDGTKKKSGATPRSPPARLSGPF